MNEIFRRMPLSSVRSIAMAAQYQLLSVASNDTLVSLWARNDVLPAATALVRRTIAPDARRDALLELHSAALPCQYPMESPALGASQVRTIGGDGYRIAFLRAMANRNQTPVSNHPPVAPDLPRVLRFTRRQWIGIPLIGAIPLLALCGIFGAHITHVEARGRQFGVRIEYPDRIHYRQPLPVAMTIRNTSGMIAESISIVMDTSYMRAFSAIHFVPAPSRAYALDLTPIAPGEDRLVRGDMTGERFGRHRGVVTVMSHGDTVRMPISTFVFP